MRKISMGEAIFSLILGLMLIFAWIYMFAAGHGISDPSVKQSFIDGSIRMALYSALPIALFVLSFKTNSPVALRVISYVITVFLIMVLFMMTAFANIS